MGNINIYAESPRVRLQIQNFFTWHSEATDRSNTYDKEQIGVNKGVKIRAKFVLRPGLSQSQGFQIAIQFR